MTYEEIEDLPVVYRLRGLPLRSERLVKLLLDAQPLDTLPPMLVYKNPRTLSNPPLFHFGFPATADTMTQICKNRGFGEGVVHETFGDFRPESVFAYGRAFITQDLQKVTKTKLVWGSPSSIVFIFGDNRSSRHESSKACVAQLKAYLEAQGIPCDDEPKWYLDREKYYWGPVEK